MDNKKVNPKILQESLDEWKLHSYHYSKELMMLHRTNIEKDFTQKFIEIFCDKITKTQIIRFVKKMKNIGFTINSKNHKTIKR